MKVILDFLKSGIYFLNYICVAVLLVSYTLDIIMVIFDVETTLQAVFNSQLSTMGIGELIGIGIENMIVVSLCMKIMSVLITVMLYGRMIEIYLYVSVAPVPFATLSNREWGSIGSNYIKGLCALAF